MQWVVSLLLEAVDGKLYNRVCNFRCLLTVDPQENLLLVKEASDLHPPYLKDPHALVSTLSRHLRPHTLL